MVKVRFNIMSSGWQPELACSEPVVVMVLQIFENHNRQEMRKRFESWAEMTDTEWAA